MKTILKHFILITLSILFSFTAYAQNKIAIMDFRAGTGVDNVEGMSAVFSTYFTPQGYMLVERTQIDRVIDEQGFQRSTLTQEQMAEIGQILNIKKMVVGDIIVLGGQYEIDVRIVDVATGEVGHRDGETWSKGISYRDVMRKLAERLVSKMNTDIENTSMNLNVGNDTNSNDIVILYGYLKVFPEDLGTFSSPPINVIKNINSSIPYGYNDWRIPTVEEMALIKANRSKIPGIGNGEYMTSDGKTSGILRLVTTGNTFLENEAIRKQQEAEQRHKEELKQAQEAERRRLTEELEQTISTLSPFDAARYYMLTQNSWDIKYVSSSPWGSERPRDWYIVDYRQLSKIPIVQKFLQLHSIWWAYQDVDNYNNEGIPDLDSRGKYVWNWLKISVYDSQNGNYTTQRMVYGSRHEYPRLPSDVVYQYECSYPELYYRRLDSGEATKLANQIILTALEQQGKFDVAKYLSNPEQFNTQETDENTSVLYCDGVYPYDNANAHFFAYNLQAIDRDDFAMAFEFLVMERKKQWPIMLSENARILGVFLDNDGHMAITTNNQEHLYQITPKYSLNQWHRVFVYFSKGSLYVQIDDNPAETLIVEMFRDLGDNILSSVNFSNGIAFKGYLRNIGFQSNP